MPNDDLLTATQVGQLIGCSSRTVIRWADAGKLPLAMQLPGPNGAHLFRRADVTAMLTAKQSA